MFTVEALEALPGAQVSPAQSAAGYGVNFSDAGTQAAAATVCALQPELCVVVVGTSAVVLTVYVTWPYLAEFAKALSEAISLPTVDQIKSDCKPGRLVVEAAIGKKYRGGTSYEQEDYCPGGSYKGGNYVIHWIERDGNIIHGPHIRQGHARGGGGD